VVGVVASRASRRTARASSSVGDSLIKIAASSRGTFAPANLLRSAVLWIAGLAVLVLLEKVVPTGHLVPRFAGAALAAAGQ